MEAEAGKARAIKLEAQQASLPAQPCPWALSLTLSDQTLFFQEKSKEQILALQEQVETLKKQGQVLPPCGSPLCHHWPRYGLCMDGEGN